MSSVSMRLKSKIQTFTMVFALLAIWGVFQWVTHGAFIEPGNLSNLFRQMSVTGVLATGMLFVIVAGHIDLSVGSTVALLGAILAVFSNHAGMSPLGAFAITLLAGGILGLIQGFFVAYQKIPAFIVTLGGMLIFRGAAMWETQNTTVPLPDSWVKNLGTAYLPIQTGWILVSACLVILLFRQIGLYRRNVRLHQRGNLPFVLGQGIGIAALLVALMAVFAKYQGVPVPVLILFALMALMSFIGMKTIWGRHIYAIGGNPDAAFLSGVPVKIRTFTLFALMGVLSALGAVILTARVGSASPDAGQLLELDAIAACVIGGTSLKGGKGSVFGAILGALVMESLNNGMSMANMEAFWQYMIKGAVLVLAVWADVLSREK